MAIDGNGCFLFITTYNSITCLIRVLWYGCYKNILSVDFVSVEKWRIVPFGLKRSSRICSSKSKQKYSLYILYIIQLYYCRILRKEQFGCKIRLPNVYMINKLIKWALQEESDFSDSSDLRFLGSTNYKTVKTLVGLGNNNRPTRMKRFWLGGVDVVI